MQRRQLDLPEDLRQQLQYLARLPSTPQRLALRARCALMVSDGVGVRETARQLEIRPQTVRKWVKRISIEGLKGLH
ncbi:MAG TPA: helix-turn-helix domain-containing protein, partial [Candidatus Dormibacteraeota bacterium]|nr:helix-turn-helix domain-containing protein [Candidatus Dormibacteraeota bacterium]